MTHMWTKDTAGFWVSALLVLPAYSIVFGGWPAPMSLTGTSLHLRPRGACQGAPGERVSRPSASGSSNGSFQHIKREATHEETV